MTLKPIRLEGLALEALEALPQPLWAFDRETLKFVWANDVALEWLGYSRNLLFSKTIVDLRPAEFQKAIAEAAANFKDIAVDAGTWPIVTGSGKLLNAAVHWRSVIFNGREAVLASVRDLTEYVRIEREREELRKENSALRAADGIAIEHFQRLFESAPTKFLVVRPYTYEIVAVSDAYAASTLSSRDQLVGKRVFEMFPDDPDDKQADGVKNLQESFRRVETLKAPDSMAVQRYPVRRPDGKFEERYWTCVNSPVTGPDGELAYIVHRAEDVTALYLEPRTAEEIERAPLLRDVLLQAQELRHALTRTQ
ncbi:MAG: PAS domain S-box protein, partial [Alphaproteobacteria bacterium]|nr:PAS domain S-box protein [Alphaproteobacteria bacterium]MDX5414997.1 PAS domain S-box protein [Alphaproteobacteria bacterium]MDX5492182.1 PAS domain S-box protein [Alphaproteobacteria bacterium]